MANRSDKAIASVTFRLEEDGKLLSEYTSFNLNVAGSDPRQFIQPGKARFLFPDTTITRMVNIEGQGVPSEMVATFRDDLQRKIENLRQHNAKPRLDCVIWVDGTQEGPDQSGVANRFNAWLRAEQDLYQELTTRTGFALRRHLETIPDEKPSERPEDVDYYGRHKKMLAGELLHSLDQGGEETFKSNIATRQKNHERRLPLVRRKDNAQ